MGARSFAFDERARNKAMATLAQFSTRIARRADQIAAGVGRLKRKTVLAADREVVFATPVDTGRARSNWIVSIGTPDRSVRAPFSAGVGLGIGENANGAAAFNDALAKLNPLRPIGAEVSVYIQNNVPYIGRLNAGSSQQAPAGFVQTGILNGVAVIRRGLRQEGVRAFTG